MGLACACSLAFASHQTVADQSYKYTGNTITNVKTGEVFDTTMKVSGSVVLSEALPPSVSNFVPIVQSFRWTAGDITWTEDNSVVYSVRFATDDSGAIVNWGFMLQTATTDVSGRFVSGDVSYTVATFYTHPEWELSDIPESDQLRIKRFAGEADHWGNTESTTTDSVFSRDRRGAWLRIETPSTVAVP